MSPTSRNLPADPPALQIARRLLPYNGRLERRQKAEIDLIVLHATELPGMAEAREYGERIHHPASRTGNSGHYYLDRDGSIEQYVEDLRVAHHVRGHNRRSLGLELVNLGRYPHWYRAGHQEPREPFPEAQIATTVRLIQELGRRYPGIRGLAAHSDLDQDLLPAEDDPETLICRKIDPGPLFPWRQVLAATGLPRLEKADL